MKWGNRRKDRRFLDDPGERAARIVDAIDLLKSGFMGDLDNDEQHRLKHAALNRITVLEGTLDMVAHDMENCTCGALSRGVAELIAKVKANKPL